MITQRFANSSLSLSLNAAAAAESFLSGSSSVYVEEMYEAWSYDPKSVHASWDAYFRGGAYQSPPTLGSKYPAGALPVFYQTFRVVYHSKFPQAQIHFNCFKTLFEV